MHTSLQSACLIILFIHCSGGAEGKVVCEYCCKEFIGSIGKVKFALREHVAAVHLGIRKSCDECGKTFVSNIVLNKHKKHVHRREGSYPCRVCGKVFRSLQPAGHRPRVQGPGPGAVRVLGLPLQDGRQLGPRQAQEGLPRPAQGGRGQCSARPQSSVIVSKYFADGHVLCSILSIVM